MAKLGRFQIPQAAMTGFILGIFTPVLVWLVGFITTAANWVIAQVQGRGALITGTDLGSKVLQTLTGRFAFTMPDLLVAGLGGAVLVVAGTYIYNMKWSPDKIPGLKATPVTKLGLVLFYASILATAVLAWSFALPVSVVLHVESLKISVGLLLESKQS